MSDTPTPGDRLDAKLAELRTAFDALQSDFAAAAVELGEEFSQRVDALSAKIDEVQAVWDARDAGDDTAEAEAE